VCLFDNLSEMNNLSLFLGRLLISEGTKSSEDYWILYFNLTYHFLANHPNVPSPRIIK